MKISDLTWRGYCIPFRKPFVTAHGPLSQRVGVLVSVWTDAGYVGHGEIAPLPSQNGESLESVLSALPRLAGELRGCEIETFFCQHATIFANKPNPVHSRRVGEAKTPRARPEVGSDRSRITMDWMAGTSRLPSALVCGLETALLDVIGQARGQSVAALLASGYPLAEGRESSVPRACVPVNVVIGGETIEPMVAQARAAVDAGFGCLKLKIIASSEEEIKRVAAVRAALGSTPSLRLDANESWNFEQACEMLTRCAPYDIQYVEQPLPAADLAGMARLRRVSPIPLAVDEALTGLESARRVLDAGAADVLILKPQLAGGLLACREIVQQASERNVACVITSTLEAGIGVAAALHLAAALPEITLSCGLATLGLLEDNLLRDGLTIEQGCMVVPSSPGLGVALDEDALKCYTL